MYKLLRSFLFLFDAEKVHYFSMNALKFFCKIPLVKKWIANQFVPKGNNDYSVFNLQFPNRVGLGAGFDKNALYLDELAVLGFGFVEIGTVTPRPQKGNPTSRLFRLKKDRALINRMGFNNDGADVISERLKRWREDKGQSAMVNASPDDRSSDEGQSAPDESGENRLSTKGKHHSPFTTQHSPIIIGANLGKNKDSPNEDAWKDYGYCFEKLYDVADYFVVNVSSPNTAGLRELQDKESLRKILAHLQTLNTKHLNPKPVLLKISPDLSLPQTDDVISLAMEIKLDGLIVANTTISRDNLLLTKEEINKMGVGGLSGKPLMKRSTEMLSYISKKTNGSIPLIASGGIFTAEDAKEKINNGASLVQIWTGFIYEGPEIVKNIINQL